MFQRLIQEEAGIFLAPAKKTLLVSRLRRRLCELQLRSFGAYYLVARDDPAERTRMLDRICTNETRFFREPWQFDVLAKTVLPRLRERSRAHGSPRRLRVWSAGCSSGEEPYSLAMLLLHELPAHEGWTVDILATDLSTRILDRARQATYPADRAKDIPDRLVRSYVRRASGGRADTVQVGLEARSVVRFERLNLSRDDYPSGGPFDLIFCRNVLIYFDAHTRARVVSGLLRRLTRPASCRPNDLRAQGGVGDVDLTLAATRLRRVCAAAAHGRRGRIEPAGGIRRLRERDPPG